jgi:carboxylesterase
VFLLIVGVIAAAVLAVELLRSAAWRASERALAERFPLGSDGVIRGAQSIYHGGHARAALLLHGFGDTPQSLEVLARRLANAGWSVSVPLLPGHARTLKEFHASRATDWTQAARTAYEDLVQRHETVVLCGQSLGADIALELESTRPVPALVLLAPYIAMPAIARLGATLWPIFQWVVPIIYTRDRRSIHDPQAGAKSLAYGYTSPRLLSELWQVVQGARRHLAEVRSPTLIVHSREDNRVPADEVAAAAARIKHPVKAIQWVSGCGHVIAADYCKDTVAAHVIEWFERCTSPQGATTTAR